MCFEGSCGSKYKSRTPRGQLVFSSVHIFIIFFFICLGFLSAPTSPLQYRATEEKAAAAERGQEREKGDDPEKKQQEAEEDKELRATTVSPLDIAEGVRSILKRPPSHRWKGIGNGQRERRVNKPPKTKRRAKKFLREREYESQRPQTLSNTFIGRLGWAVQPLPPSIVTFIGRLGVAAPPSPPSIVTFIGRLGVAFQPLPPSIVTFIGRLGVAVQPLPPSIVTFGSVSGLLLQTLHSIFARG